MLDEKEDGWKDRILTLGFMLDTQVVYVGLEDPSGLYMAHKGTHN